MGRAKGGYYVGATLHVICATNPRLTLHHPHRPQAGAPLPGPDTVEAGDDAKPSLTFPADDLIPSLVGRAMREWLTEMEEVFVTQ